MKSSHLKCKLLLTFNSIRQNNNRFDLTHNLENVAYSVENNDTYEREMSPFNIIKDNISQKILITNDDLDYSTSVVRHIKLKDFLMLDTL